MKKVEKIKTNNNVLRELVRKSVKTQYRNSFLGMFWTVLNPLLNMLVMWLIFSQFFGNDDPLYPIYLLTGNILFSSLSSATNGALRSVVSNRGLLLRTKIDSHLFPLASTLSSLVSFGFSFIALIVIMFFMQVIGGYNLFGYQMLFVILMIPAFVLFEYGIGLFLSAIYVYCRDIKHLYTVVLKLWTYLTPVFYKINRLAEGSIAYSVVKLNPMYYFLHYFREAVYNVCYTGGDIPLTSSWGFVYLLGLYAFGLASILIGSATFKLLKKNFMTNI